jgi:hypothetical protein
VAPPRRRLTPPRAVRAAAEILQFVLELSALAALAWWGSTIDPTAVGVLLAIASPALAATVWGIWAAPRSSRRLAGAARIAVELLVFGSAAAALAAGGAPVLALVFAVVVLCDVAVVGAGESTFG